MSIRQHLGIGWCTYEGAALAVGDATVLPPWTTICHPREDAPPQENHTRLALALISVGWVTIHLLRPWVRWIHHATTQRHADLLRLGRPTGVDAGLSERVSRQLPRAS